MAALGPFGPAPRLAVGVSGGPHSLALTVLAAEWAAARGGFVLPLVVDHGLRAGSAAEAARVAARLLGRGLPARVLTLSLPPGPALQARARAARLRALLDACRADAAPWLLLGHHAGDQAETILSRALAGSGPAGLAGMAPARAEAEAMILRPLLGMAPEALEAVVLAAGMTPERDPSNANARFLRVRLRGIEAPASQAALIAAGARFAARRARLEGAMAERLARSVTLSPLGHARIARGALGTDALAVAALGEVIRLVSGAPFAPARDSLAALLARGEGTLGGTQLRPGPCGEWLLMREYAAMAAPIPARPGALWDGRFRLTGPGDPGFTLGALGAEAIPTRLPLSLRRTLPAIRTREGTLAAVPSLDYPSLLACRPFALAFAPQGGAPLAWAPPPTGRAES